MCEFVSWETLVDILDSFPSVSNKKLANECLRLRQTAEGYTLRPLTDKDRSTVNVLLRETMTCLRAAYVMRQSKGQPADRVVALHRYFVGLFSSILGDEICSSLQMDLLRCPLKDIGEIVHAAARLADTPLFLLSRILIRRSLRTAEQNVKELMRCSAATDRSVPTCAELEKERVPRALATVRMVGTRGFSSTFVHKEPLEGQGAI